MLLLYNCGWHSGFSFVLNDFKESEASFLCFLFSTLYWIANSNYFDNVSLKSTSLFPKNIDNIANCFSCLCTYDLYGPVRNVSDACRYTLRGQVGGGWTLEIKSFLGPVKWHRADRLFPPLLQCGKATLPHCSPPPHNPELIRNQQETVRCIKERSGNLIFLYFFRKRTRPGPASSTAAPSSTSYSTRGRSSTQSASSVGGRELEDSSTVSETVFVTERQYLVEPTTSPIRYGSAILLLTTIPAVSFTVFPLLNIEVMSTLQVSVGTHSGRFQKIARHYCFKTRSEQRCIHYGETLKRHIFMYQTARSFKWIKASPQLYSRNYLLQRRNAV